MEPPEGVAFRDRAVYLAGPDALVLADLHVGRDATSEVELPVGERRDLTQRFAALLSHFDPGTVVLAGDLLHSFSTVPRGTGESLDDLAALAADAGARAVVTPGNHDAMLGELWSGETADALRLVGGSNAGDGSGDALVRHGHEAPDERAPRYVVGHDHPCIEIEGRKRPCYLYGRDQYRGGDVLMVPAFSRLVPGVTVNRLDAGAFMSPLVTDADGLAPIVRDEDADETLAFPPLGRFRRML